MAPAKIWHWSDCSIENYTSQVCTAKVGIFSLALLNSAFIKLWPEKVLSSGMDIIVSG